VKVAIVGAAGTLGSCAAFIIATQKLADELLLIDPWENMLKAHWMDLTTAAAGQDVLVRRGTFKDLKGFRYCSGNRRGAVGCYFITF